MGYNNFEVTYKIIYLYYFERSLKIVFSFGYYQKLKVVDVRIYG